MGTRPAWSVLTFASSLSTQITLWPTSAKQAPVTSPTYPEPMIEISMNDDCLYLLSLAQPQRQIVIRGARSVWSLALTPWIEIQIKTKLGKGFKAKSKK